MPTALACRPAPPQVRLDPHPKPITAARLVLQELVDTGILLEDDFNALPDPVQEELLDMPATDQLLVALAEHGLLTEYQAARVAAGKTFGLVLGNYRVLDRLGAGGMGVVFKAEHIDMRRVVAVKVLPLYPDQDPILLRRFLTEVRAVARLNHPNIVAAFDAGTTPRPDADSPSLRYFVMEYVPGRDLELQIKEGGPLAIASACDLAHQIASALAEAYKFNLVHRDIKPSNVLVTPEEQAKLLDFGLALRAGNRFTEPGTMLGTFDFMAPEQARDASTVDIRADIYGLGGTLFWCLTGQIPFPCQGTMLEDLARRLNSPPPSARLIRPDIPADLDAVIARMMALDPEDRFATPQAVMQALLPFLRSAVQGHVLRLGGPADLKVGQTTGELAAARRHRTLIVDDELGIRALGRQVLLAEGFGCDEAPDGETALDLLQREPYDLVVLDVNMPGISGLEVLRRLRETRPCPNLKVVMISGRFSSDEMTQMLLAGSDDYLTKPFSMVQLQVRVKTLLRLKEAQDRSEILNRHLLAVNAELERTLTARDSDLVQARNALVLALAKLVEHRDIETGAHLTRLQRYSRCLAEEVATLPVFAGQINQGFIELLECCAPLHDIGKMGLPDHILQKPGKVDLDERFLMQAHTTIGADTLLEVVRQYGFALGFLQMAMDITRHHHERYDGGGYPDRLAGDAIPLAARIVAVGDVYDALRSRRVYKPGLSHTAAVHLMIDASPGQFDPLLLQGFQRCARRFEQIFHDVAD